MQVNRRRIGRRIRSAAVAAVALLLALTAAVGLGAAPAQAGTTLAAKQKCTYGSSKGTIQTCLVIHGQGLDVTDATASAKNHGKSGHTLEICITGPGRFKICAGPSYIGPGDTVLDHWFPKVRVPAGSYHARTYEKNANGSFTQVGDAPITLP